MKTDGKDFPPPVFWRGEVCASYAICGQPEARYEKLPKRTVV